MTQQRPYDTVMAARGQMQAARLKSRRARHCVRPPADAVNLRVRHGRARRWSTAIAAVPLLTTATIGVLAPTLGLHPGLVAAAAGLSAILMLTFAVAATLAARAAASPETFPAWATPLPPEDPDLFVGFMAAPAVTVPADTADAHPRVLSQTR